MKLVEYLLSLGMLIEHKEEEYKGMYRFSIFWNNITCFYSYTKSILSVKNPFGECILNRPIIYDLKNYFFECDIKNQIHVLINDLRRYEYSIDNNLEFFDTQEEAEKYYSEVKNKELEKAKEEIKIIEDKIDNLDSEIEKYALEL